MTAQRGQELWAVTQRGSELHNAPILQLRTQEQVKKLKEHLTPKAHSPKHLMHCPTESHGEFSGHVVSREAVWGAAGPTRALGFSFWKSWALLSQTQGQAWPSG